MEKYQFSKVGMNAMLADVYALHDESVSAFADEMAKDFKHWAITYFAFTESQLRDLSQLNEQWAAFLASQGSFAIRNRRPIQLIKPTDIMSGSFGDKLVKFSSSLSAVSNREGSFCTGGELVIEVSYGRTLIAQEVFEQALLSY